MQSNCNTNTGITNTSRQGMLVLMSLNTLYHYMYCMMVSSAFSMTPVIGGALFMSGRVSDELMRRMMGERRLLPGGLRVAGMILLVFMLLCNLTLLAIYPFFFRSFAIWGNFAVVQLIILRNAFAKRLVVRRMRQTMSGNTMVWMMILLEAFPLCLVGVIYFLYMGAFAAWQMTGGFVLGALLEGYSLWREKEQIGSGSGREMPRIDISAVGMIVRELKGIRAYYMFERFHSLILVALQITLVIVYTFVGVTSQALFTGMVIAAGLTLFLRELTDILLRRVKNRQPAATQLLLAGLFLWIYGLMLFYRGLGHAPNVFLSNLSLALSMSGVTISITCLAELEQQMSSVAQFGLNCKTAGYEQVRADRTEMAIMMGQMIALIMLTVLCAPWISQLDATGVQALLEGIRPLMILPPMFLLLGAFVSVLRFPINSRYFQKLKRFLTLRDEGGVNLALKAQLDEVVIKRHKNRIGVKLIMTVLRPLYYHKVRGKENVTGHEDGSMILVCNHGELYGPVVANLYVPISFRPWTLSNMMDREAIVEHMYTGTMIRQKWIPERFKKPLIRLFYPLLGWIFKSIESIPVYRNEPEKLIQTFRATVEAMQAGDNILLFPEVAESPALGEKGYAEEGMGKIYTGFVMLGRAYYTKTGKRAVFVPIYASKKTRSLLIGQGIAYDPGRAANEEKIRIVGALIHQMKVLYEQETGTVEDVKNARRINRKQ